MDDSLIVTQKIIDDYSRIHTMFHDIQDHYEEDKYQQILDSYLAFFRDGKYGPRNDINLNIEMYPMILSDAKHMYFIYEKSNIGTAMAKKTISILKEMQDFIYKSNAFDQHSVNCVLKLEELIQKMHDGTETGNIYWVDILIRERMWEFYFIYENAAISINNLTGMSYEYNILIESTLQSSILHRYFPFLTYYCASACYSEDTSRNARIFAFIRDNNNLEGFANNCIALMWLNDDINISPLLLRMEGQIQKLQKQKNLFPWGSANY
jgi:hypothetical protein